MEVEQEKLLVEIDLPSFNEMKQLSKRSLRENKSLIRWFNISAIYTESERSALCKRKADSIRNYAEAKLISE